MARNVSDEEIQLVSFHPGAVLTETARAHGYDENTIPWDEGNLFNYPGVPRSVPVVPLFLYRN